MAKSFNIVAQLQIQGGSSARRVAQQIQRQLSGINATVNINVARNTAASLKAANKHLLSISRTLTDVSAKAQQAQTAISSLSGPLNKAASSSSKLGSAAKSAAGDIDRTAKGLSQAATQAQQFGHDSALAVRRFLAFSIPAGIVLGLVAAFKKGISEAISFERELIII